MNIVITLQVILIVLLVIDIYKKEKLFIQGHQLKEDFKDLDE